MSLPSSEPLPNDAPQTPRIRRRRVHRLNIPAEANERAQVMDKLARRTLPSFDFFLFSLLTGAILAAGILLDSPTLFFLGALTAPFMAPVIGLSLSSVIGSGWFFVRTLSGILVGSLLVFIAGVLAGLASYLSHDLALTQAAAHAHITWIDFGVLTLGVLLLTISLARSEQKSLISSVVLAYELYLPAGVAGFGLSISLTGGTTTLWPSALVTFIFYLTWAVFLAIVTLWVSGIRPLNLFGYVLGVLVAIVCLVIGLEVSGLAIQTPAVVGITTTPTRMLPTNTQVIVPTDPTPTPTLTQTPATPESITAFTLTVPRTPTHTLVPSATPTETLTPAPTAIWAIVRANNGAYVRAEPNFNAKIVDGVLGGSLVQVLPETAQDGTTTWVHVITSNGIKGWIVQSILVTATPVPTW